MKPLGPVFLAFFTGMLFTLVLLSVSRRATLPSTVTTAQQANRVQSENTADEIAVQTAPLDTFAHSGDTTASARRREEEAKPIEKDNMATTAPTSAITHKGDQNETSTGVQTDAPVPTQHACRGEVTSSVAQDVREFEQFAHRCTDKASLHRFQHVYAVVLHKYRNLPQFQHRSSPSAATEGRGGSEAGHQPAPPKLKMLEIGLGCNMIKCVAGGFRLMQKYLPQVEYHVFEFNMPGCRSRYKKSRVTKAQAAYIESHLCEGSSADPEALRRCGEKFGPFDIIIDDASHIVAHVVAAYRYWFPSKHLKYGGVYVIEDMHTEFIPEYAQHQGNQTMSRLISDLLRWKLAMAPNSRVPSGEVGPTVFPETRELALLTQIVTCGAEICAFEKVPNPI